ncbi:MAG: hypothetical protein GWP08_09920 [Nitrospiraceae bacterium]|nr:hypothetical protein [Nitrospiraceae bacterium]
MHHIYIHRPFFVHLAATVATAECVYFGLKKFMIGAIFSVGLTLLSIPRPPGFHGMPSSFLPGLVLRFDTRAWRGLESSSLVRGSSAPRDDGSGEGQQQ